MRKRKARSLTAAAALIAGVTGGASAQQTYGPLPYLSFADSPFNGQPFTYFHLDDFEPTTSRPPGYTATAGGVILGPGALTDSVDGDDLTIDGSGTGGSSWFSDGTTIAFRFAFDATVLGHLPSHVGIVWTDVGVTDPNPEFPSQVPPPGVADVAFLAWGPSDTFLGIVNASNLGDGAVTGATAEDRFFGIALSDPAAPGIARVDMYTYYSRDWEVDHLQYGYMNPVPEPAQWLLMSLGLGAVAALRRR